MNKTREEQIEKYKKYLTEEFKQSINYNRYLNEINQDIISFLEILNIKEENKLDEFSQFINELMDVSQKRYIILDNAIKFLNSNSEKISFKDVQAKTMLYNRILKIKHIDDGCTEV